MFSSPADHLQESIDPFDPEPAGQDDPIVQSEPLPTPRLLEIIAREPVDADLDIIGDPRMYQGLLYRFIGIDQRGVLTDDSDPDRPIPRVLDPIDHRFPGFEGRGWGLEPQLGDDELVELLIMVL